MNIIIKKGLQAIESGIQLDIPVSKDCLSVEYDQIINRLEAIVESLKEKRNKYAETILGSDDKLVIQDTQVSRVKVFSKVADFEKLSEKFVKLEKKINTQAVAEYQKKHRELPDGITEVLSSERIKISFKKQEEKNPTKRVDMTDFKLRFNKND